MKQVFRCEYCDHMGTEEDVLKHEQECIWNRDKRTCATCKKCDRGFLKYKCNDDKEILDGQMFVNCDKYEWEEVISNSNTVVCRCKKCGKEKRYTL